jgi:hydrogenase maturation protein HypF
VRAQTLHITGIVQGVGFRPFVYNLAKELELDGWVLNSSDGVFCTVQGSSSHVDSFLRRVSDDAPPMAVIQSVITEEIEPEVFDGFSIRESAAIQGARTLISPDVATCDACASELADPSDRRHRYPFINCTNCGPRFTIISDIPYDRPLTTMAAFPMCPDCAKEYADPTNRRFHAQPDACFVCGPRLFLNANSASADAIVPPAAAWSPEVEIDPRPHRDRETESVRSDEILATASRLLLDGRILAIKSLGGFHVSCDATNEDAVRELRERKHRKGKPLAIMVSSVQEARVFCEINAQEEELLAGHVRPIVLLKLREDVSSPVAESVAGGLREMGVMLPYTPLHHLLLSDVGRPLVMTSGNISDEPIATDNAEALVRLHGIVDAFLMHDRAIHSRYDDSVVRVVGDIVEPVRRARGYAPFPLELPFETDVDILATGTEQKNTFTLLSGRHAFVSQHIGDMENAETLEAYEKTIGLYQDLFRIDPKLVAYDLHPEYLSTKFAHSLNLPKTGVQHHHAHIVSVTAEHGVEEPVVGFAFDGTGFGEDGTIWGGEVLLSTWSSYERLAHLAVVPMPGGAAAVRRPARMAVGTMLGLDPAMLEHPGAAPLLSRLEDGEERLLRQMVERRVNTPLTSSMGRLFDAVSALVGIRDEALYEGQAAIELEAAADLRAEGSYQFGMPSSENHEIDPRPVFWAILDDIDSGIPPGVISIRFHRAVSQGIVSLGKEEAACVGARHVALAGGVFMNRLVLGATVRGLENAGLQPLTHVSLPMNDGAVSFGQAVVAWARRHEV